MNYFDISEEVLAEIRERYPKGTEIILEEMKGESRMPKGLKGIVDHVDDIGQIHVKWENGLTLALIPNEDRYKKLTEERKQNKERE